MSTASLIEVQAPRYQPLQIERLNAMNGPEFARFTFPSYQSYLTLSPPSLQILGAWALGQPAGLLIAEAMPQKGSAQVLSVCVAAEHRREGIASALMQSLESDMAAAGIGRLHATFASGRASTPGVTGLLAREGWSEPTRKHWICTAGLRFRTAPWVDHYKLSPEFEVLPWVELPEEDREKLRAAEWVPYDLSPFRNEVHLDPLCSIALRYHGEPVGWVLAQQRGEDTLVYASSYVRPNLRGRGHLIAAYAEACKRQTGQTERNIGVWIVPMNYPPMAAFAERRMRPYLDSLDEFLTAEKHLSAHISDQPQ